MHFFNKAFTATPINMHCLLVLCVNGISLKALNRLSCENQKSRTEGSYSVFVYIFHMQIEFTENQKINVHQINK